MGVNLLGDTVDAALPVLAEHAESLMDSVAEIRKPGRVEYDPEADLEVYVPGQLVWSGKVRVRPNNQATEEISAEQQVSEQAYRCTAPRSMICEKDDLMTIIAGNDPYLQGRTLTVSSMQGQSIGYQRRFTALDNLG